MRFGSTGKTHAAGPLLAIIGLLLAACSGDDAADSGIFCPDYARVSDASQLIKFDGTGRDISDVIFEARLDDVQMSCTYDEDDNTIEANMQVALSAARGPADQQRAATFRYFVAIAAPGQRVVAREEFAVSMPFEGNQTQIRAIEEVAPTIPLRPGQSGSEYKIFVGLVLNAAELKYNRANR